MSDAKLPATAAAESRQGIIQWAASTYGVDAGKVMGVLRGTCFKVAASDAPATDAEVAALLIVARHYKLNPFLRQIYAFRQKGGGGIVPIVGVDGWAAIINDQPNFDGVKFEYQYGESGKVESITCTIHRKDRKYPTEITEFLDECYRDTDPWKRTTRRMLRHRAFMQCGRLAFGLSGIHDDDEGEVIAASGAGQAVPLDLDEKAQPEQTSRVSSLAGDLVKRAKNVQDAELIDSETGEIKPVNAETLYLAIEQAMTQQELAELQGKIMMLPADPTRVDLLTKWNARSIELGKPAQTTSAPLPQSAAPSANASASPAPATVREAGATAAAESGEKEQGAPTTTAAAPKPKKDEKKDENPDGPEAAEKVIEQIKAGKTQEELDAIAERENKRKWTKELRRKIYDAYMQASQKMEGP